MHYFRDQGRRDLHPLTPWSLIHYNKDDNFVVTEIDDPDDEGLKYISTIKNGSNM